MAPFKRQITYSSRPNHRARAAHSIWAVVASLVPTTRARCNRSVRRGRWIAFVAVIVVVALLLILGVSTLVRGCTSGNLAADGQQVTVEVADGESTSSIAQSLQQAGLVSSAGDFTKKVSDLGLDGSLQPGTYTLTSGMSLEDLAKTLSAGPGLSGPSVTIPEGLTLTNIAGRVSDATNGRISADDFKAQASNASVYASDFPFLKDAGTNSLEGFLFPKTYAVSSTDTADSLIRAMLSQYQTEVATLDYSYPTSKNFNSYQTLILASIIEKEASDDADIRAKVSAVFYNRLLNTGAPTYGLSWARTPRPPTRSAAIPTTTIGLRTAPTTRAAMPVCPRRPSALRASAAFRRHAIQRPISTTTTSSRSGRMTRARLTISSTRPTTSTRRPSPLTRRRCCGSSRKGSPWHISNPIDISPVFLRSLSRRTSLDAGLKTCCSTSITPSSPATRR